MHCRLSPGYVIAIVQLCELCLAGFCFKALFYEKAKLSLYQQPEKKQQSTFSAAFFVKEVFSK